MKPHIAALVPILASFACVCLFHGCDRAASGPPQGPPAPASQPAAARRPNVLLVSLDTLRPDHLSLFGYAKPTSPNLARFAEGGVRFTHARAQAPWTLPSHMSLFTSMLPSHNGVDNLNNVLPEGVPTLAQLLRDGGYRTAALVNDGQMHAHWGFDRGFDSWAEFKVDTPEGDCDHITGEAVRWLAEHGRGDKPFFLFLHYYDTHDPYDAPPAWRERMGTPLTGEQAREVAWRYRYPAGWPGAPGGGADIEDPELLRQLVAAYDAEIAWLDSELARLFAAVPPDTLVVVFSDHGEAFEEHGWLLHGATLFEEEVRVMLMMRLPERGSVVDGSAKPRAAGNGAKPRAVVDEPVMLMDVAPTILAMCGLAPPAHAEGIDLSPLLTGGTLGERLIPSEAKAVLEGRLLYSAVLGSWKGVYAPLDGAFHLFKLPDERTDLAATEPKMAEALSGPLRRWVAEGEYWTVRAHGRGDFEATIESPGGPIALFIPVGLEPERDNFEISEDGRRVQWHVYPSGGVKTLYFQIAPGETGPGTPAGVRFDLKINGNREPGQTFFGAGRTAAAALPVQTDLADDPSDPAPREPFRAEAPGFYISRHGEKRSGAASHGSVGATRRVAPLDPKTIEELRSLGYLQ